jgi:hypothetical protein
MKTYVDKRKCLNCSKPIADQEHGLQKFCPREVLPDGSIKNCKDEYWSAIRREKMLPFIQFAYFQKDQCEIIGALAKRNQEYFSLEELNRHGINLHRPAFFKFENNQYEFYFHQYGIKQLPHNKFKIFTHELY